MHKAERNEPCPCGSGIKFKKCCAPALDAITWPETAEALMRSRYTAFVVGNTTHLYRTTHPANDQVKGISPEQFARETLQFCKVIDFKKLTIHQVWPEDEHGVARVHFTTEYHADGKDSTMSELSEFSRLDGRWVYTQGEESAHEG